ncbi:hypothetical protein J6Z37_02405 [Candidatus Saccharibacteria bacterium]|nr:hypothetical protein [Candidatus Saccharibacteria bacterium]
MGKITSLLRASMTEGMQIFQLGKRNKNGKKVGPGLPILLAGIICIATFGYANMLLDSLAPAGAGFVVLTLFVFITSILTLIEGIYKSGSLLFNCRDDNLMFSLPIKKSTVLFIRVFKFYLFEVVYNALILVPTILAYAVRVEVDWTFYLSSVLAIVLLPVIPVVISCLIGGMISGFSARFKMKNIIQIVLTMAFALGVILIAGSLDKIIAKIAENSASINDLITKIYYPAGAYVGLVTEFNVVNMLVFIFVNIALFVVMMVILGQVYFRINSRVKTIKAHSHKTEYAIKKRSVTGAIVSKELKRFTSSPVFVINAAFGLILFLFGCVMLSVNSESLASFMSSYGLSDIPNFGEILVQNAPAILFGLVIMASMMSSITSSMISLEGKSFDVLKTIPVKPLTIIMGKVLTAVLVMLPLILAGDIIMFMNFQFSWLQIVLILLASFIVPVVAELIGIATNLKYPKMNAENDAEVVKQSASSLVATFLGLGVTGLSGLLIVNMLSNGLSMDLMLGGGVMFFVLICGGLIFYIHKVGTRQFRDIEA